MLSARFNRLHLRFCRWLACLCVLIGISSSLAAGSRPNIIFILTDDLGGHDLGSYASTFYETPHLDQLAREGMRFTQAYAACNVCSPTRASIMTGKYPGRLHLTDWIPGQPDRPNHKLIRPQFQMYLPLEEFTVAEALKEGGYQTCFIGKWHLGGPAYYPEHQGFDVNIGGCELGHPPSYFSPYRIPSLPDGPKGEYLTDRLAEEAVKYLENAAKKKEPFFLYFAEYAVHTPLQAKPELVAKYKAKAAKLPAAKGPEFIIDHGHKVRQIQNHPTYAAMVESLDDSVGRVVDKLRELGIETNTIVIFTSDNGGLSTSEGWPTSNLPLRTGKGWPYEGGIREPLIVKCPGKIKPGSVCNSPMISMDYYPTILQMADLPLRPKQHLDGQSIVPLLKGGTASDRVLFWHYPHYSPQGGTPDGAVRSGDYKLIEWFENGGSELYDLKNDAGEQNDLSLKLPDETAKLLQMLHTWRQEVNAQMPGPNPNYDPNQE